MTLHEVEQGLREIRVREAVPFNFLASKRLYCNSIYHVERGENYTFSTLLKYAYYLNARVEVDGVHVADCEELGELLKKKRQAAGHSLRTLSLAAGLTEHQVINIEHGRGYTKLNFVKYIGIIPVDFNLSELMYD